MEAARDHLKPGGAFAMYNFYREDWLVDRLAGTLQEVYGREPCVDIVREQRPAGGADRGSVGGNGDLSGRNPPGR